MRPTTKKIISTLLVIVMLIGALPLGAVAGAAADDAETLFANGERYELINSGLYSKVYQRATAYVLAVRTSEGYFALGEDLGTVRLTEGEGSLTAPNGVAVVIPEAEPEGCRIIDSLYTKIGSKYLKCTEDNVLSLVDTKEGSGTRFYVSSDGDNAVYKAFIEGEEDSWKKTHALDHTDTEVPNFIMTDGKREILVYQRVCDHAGADHFNGVEPNCLGSGNLEYSYCPTCSSYVDAAGERAYINGDGYTNTYGENSFHVKPTGHRFESGVCVRCGEAARKYTLVTSDEMIVPDEKYRYIIVNEDMRAMGVDTAGEYSNMWMTTAGLAEDGGSLVIDNSSDPETTYASEFILSEYVSEDEYLPTPEDGTPLFALMTDTGYVILAMGSVWYDYSAEGAGKGPKYPYSLKVGEDGNILIKSWDYGVFGDPVAYGAEPWPEDPENPKETFILSETSNLKLYRGEIGGGTVTPQPDLGDGEFTVIIEGGEGSFDNRSDVFNSRANYDDTLSVKRTPQEGRTFKYWKTLSGETIPDEEFRMLVHGDEYIWAVYGDASDFGEWYLVSGGAICTEPIIYKRTNAEGDVEYKKEYMNGGHHDMGDAEFFDDMRHMAVCSVCGVTVYGRHDFDTEEVSLAPTHTEGGITVKHCSVCDGEVFVTTEPTEEHTFGAWEIVEPSVDGGYGKRERKCLWCDERETCFYLDVDLKDFWKDHYINFKFNTGWRVCDERYYGYTRGDGVEVYVFALQLSTSNARDNDQTYIYTYFDDNDPDTREAVYLTKTGADSPSLMGSYRFAPYAYVYDFEGFVGVIDRPSGAGVPDIVQGNGMDSHDSALMWRLDDFAEEFNAANVPVTEDPASFFTTDGEFKKWELEWEGEARAQSTLNIDGENYSGGGFANCAGYRKWISGEGDSKQYDHIIVDRATGACVYKYESATYPKTTANIVEYLPMVSAEEYAAMTNSEKAGAFSVDGVADHLVSFTRDRIGLASDFTLDVPDRADAVRVQIDRDVYNRDFTVAGRNWDYNCYSTNVAGVYYTKNTESDPEYYALTFTWKEDNENGDVFDGWQKWDFDSRTWVTVSTDPEMKINTLENPLTGYTVIRPAYHKGEVTYCRIEITNGTFIIDGEDVAHTSADVPVGARIRLEAPYVTGMRVDHFEDADGNVVDNYWDLKVTGDAVYTAVYENEEYFVNVEAYGGVGYVCAVDGEPEDEPAWDTWCSASGYIGTLATFRTEGDEEAGAVVFEGWYSVEWDEMGEVRTLISRELELTVDVSQYSQIYAVWSDGTEAEEPFITVRASLGFVGVDRSVPAEDEDDDRNRTNAYSAILSTGYDWVLVFDDPNDHKTIEKWNISYLDAEETAQTEELAPLADGASFWVDDYENYGSDKSVAVDGTVKIPGDLEFTFRMTKQATKNAPGVRTWYDPETGEIIGENEFFYLVGDVNGDCKLTLRDLSEIKKFLAGSDEELFAVVNCDIDDNEKLNLSDLLSIKKLLA